MGAGRGGRMEFLVKSGDWDGTIIHSVGDGVVRFGVPRTVGSAAAWRNDMINPLSDDPEEDGVVNNKRGFIVLPLTDSPRAYDFAVNLKSNRDRGWGTPVGKVMSGMELFDAAAAPPPGVDAAAVEAAGADKVRRKNPTVGYIRSAKLLKDKVVDGGKPEWYRELHNPQQGKKGKGGAGGGEL